MSARRLRLDVPTPVAALLLSVTLIGALSACTKSTPSGSETSTTTQTITQTPTATSTGPVNSGPIVETTAGSCPLLSVDVAKSDGGMRLNRITTLTQNGTFVGCRFYPAVFQSENLPPTSQVVIEIVVSQYATADAAHNAFITIAEKGTNFQQEDVASGNTGLCYQTTLWAPDNGKDWACTFSKGPKVVVIRTVVNGAAFNVVQIAKTVYPKI